MLSQQERSAENRALSSTDTFSLMRPYTLIYNRHKRIRARFLAGISATKGALSD